MTTCIHLEKIIIFFKLKNPKTWLLSLVLLFQVRQRALLAMWPASTAGWRAFSEAGERRTEKQRVALRAARECSRILHRNHRNIIK